MPDPSRIDDRAALGKIPARTPTIGRRRTTEPTLTNDNTTWGAVALASEGEVERVLGSLRLRLRAVGPEIWIRGSHGGEGEPDAGEWTRWSVEPGTKVELRPAMPDRPVVVAPEQPFHLPMRARARVFVRIPVFVQVVTRDGEDAESVLAELPSVVLSDTWWGTHTEGLVAYWLTTRARRTAPPEIFVPHLAVCPLHLSNASDEPLPVDRLAIRTDHLSIFGNAAATWTDEVLVEYHGASEESELTYTGEAITEAGAVRRIAGPREVPPRGLKARTFGRLKAMSGW